MTRIMELEEHYDMLPGFGLFRAPLTSMNKRANWMTLTSLVTKQTDNIVQRAWSVID